MNEWLPLPYEEWRDTRDTLHMYTQVIGKLRLALAPFEPHWMNVPLDVTSWGLTTSPMPIGSRTLDADFDFIDNVLVLRSSDGGLERRTLGGPVADFYADVLRALARLGVEVTLSVVPSEVSDPIPFPQDRAHHIYDPAQALRFWGVLAQIDSVLREHRAGFFGKSPPVSFFWGTFDLAVVRVGGRRVTPVRGSGRSSASGGRPSRSAVGGGRAIRATRTPRSTRTRGRSQPASSARRSGHRVPSGARRSASSCCPMRSRRRRRIRGERSWSSSAAPTTSG